MPQYFFNISNDIAIADRRGLQFPDQKAAEKYE